MVMIHKTDSNLYRVTDLISNHNNKTDNEETKYG